MSPHDPTGGLAFLERSRPYLETATWEESPLPDHPMPTGTRALKGTHPDGWVFTVVRFDAVGLNPIGTLTVAPGVLQNLFKSSFHYQYDGAVLSRSESTLCHMTPEFARDAYAIGEKKVPPEKDEAK